MIFLGVSLVGGPFLDGQKKKKKNVKSISWRNIDKRRRLLACTGDLYGASDTSISQKREEGVAPQTLTFGITLKFLLRIKILR